MQQPVPKIALKRVDGKLCVAKRNECWQEEKYILQHLDHPSIPKVYASDPTGGILLEFMSGKDLSQIDFDKDQIPSIFSKICNIMEYVHSYGIYHQDLKFENIVYHEATRKISIIDWEFARVEGTSSKFYGTPYYAAPEVLNYTYSGRPNDIWSIGVILYKLYCKILPFYGQCINTLTRCVNQMNPNYNHADLPDRARTMLKRIFVPYQNRITIDQLRL